MFFLISLVPYMHICLYYFLILFSYCHLLFLSLLTTRHILQFTMFNLISWKPARNITEIKKNTSCSTTKENCNQNKYSNITIFDENFSGHRFKTQIHIQTYIRIYRIFTLATKKMTENDVTKQLQSKIFWKVFGSRYRGVLFQFGVIWEVCLPVVII